MACLTCNLYFQKSEILIIFLLVGILIDAMTTEESTRFIETETRQGLDDNIETLTSLAEVSKA